MEINTTTENNQSSSIETNEIPADINHYGFRRVLTGNDPYEMYVSEYIEDTSVKFEVYKQIPPRGEHTAFYSIEAVDASKLSDEKGELTCKHIDSVARFLVEEQWNMRQITQKINAKCDFWVERYSQTQTKALIKQMDDERIQHDKNHRAIAKNILRRHSYKDAVCVWYDNGVPAKLITVEGDLILNGLDLGYFKIKGRGNEKSTQFDIDDIKCFSLNDDKLHIFMKGSHYE